MSSELQDFYMRGSSSSSRLPPIRSSVDSSSVHIPFSIESNAKLYVQSASPFSTPAFQLGGDISQSRKSISSPLEQQHPASKHDGSHRASSYWSSKFQSQSKAEFVRGDVAPLLARFEDTALYRKPHRKSLQTVLDEMNTVSGNNIAMKHSKVSLLSRQDSDPILLHRRSSLADVTKVVVRKNHREQIKASALEPPPKVVPTRFLFDGTRHQRASRCEYCNFAGGELECATCNVVAHARCYLAAYDQEDRKTKLTFVVPHTATTNSSFSSWLCSHCQSDLKTEYDERSAEVRAAHLAAQRQVLANALTAYVRMMKDATSFADKKAAIIRVQASLRGRQARQRFERLQRIRLKPYAIDALRVRAIIPSGMSVPSEGLGLGISSSSSFEELRLSNGFSCNPFLYVTVVAGNDEDTQLFCFETSVRKPMALNGTELDIVWPEKMFVPGADGYATFCFTLLSKNGPNTFFLGQAVLRLSDMGDCWRSGLVTELELVDHVEIFPKTAQHQPLPLADARGSAPKSIDHADEKSEEITRSKGRPRWLVNVHIRPFSEQHSNCGYLNMKSTLESFHTSTRWCVLADGILRIYRHFGVTLASEVVDMAHATDIRVVPIKSSAHRVNKTKKLNLTLQHDGDEGASAHSRHAEHCCLAIHHLSRLYLFQCEHKDQLRQWLKKLQGAQKFSSHSSQTHSSPVCTTPAIMSSVAGI
ncbi:hypothetical protein F441_18514 [Phytophthora nicotianae CJ01A1]|uniref:PH domain-containing protein n=1 Tax=Phytophthora nicotianae CJ01A1 TaxID=1317063 RepID=W2W328_PHYNI|nr:hypothetical protein F441_18514 [Phytophthora nicotianae CJ01A1]